VQAKLFVTFFVCLFIAEKSMRVGQGLKLSLAFIDKCTS